MSTNGKVCVKCQVELRPTKNGVGAIHMASFGAYAVFHADLWACPMCGIEVLLGFGAQSVAEHFQPGFAAECEAFERTVQFWGSETEKNEAFVPTQLAQADADAEVETKQEEER